MKRVRFLKANKVVDDEGQSAAHATAASAAAEPTVQPEATELEPLEVAELEPLDQLEPSAYDQHPDEKENANENVKCQLNR